MYGTSIRSEPQGRWRIIYSLLEKCVIFLYCVVNSSLCPIRIRLLDTLGNADNSLPQLWRITVTGLEFSK